MKDDRISEIVASVIGMKPWDARLGVGSFLTMEFGEPRREIPGPILHGEWHLWLYMCHWRIETNDRVVLCSGDDRGRMETILEGLDFPSIQAISVSYPALDLIMQFGETLKLLTFSSSSVSADIQWIFFTADGNALSILGDGSYEFGKSTEPTLKGH